MSLLSARVLALAVPKLLVSNSKSKVSENHYRNNTKFERKQTRARARRGPNTSSRRHFLMHKNNLSLWQWYIIWQNQWTMKYRSLTQIYFTRSIFESHWSIIPSTTFLHQIVFKIWTIKYRSLTYIYLIRSVYVSHWSIIPTMMFIHQIILKILSKITRKWNIGHVDLYLLWGKSLGHTVS